MKSRVGEYARLILENEALKVTLLHIAREIRKSRRPTAEDSCNRVLDFIKDRIAATGQFPAAREITDHMGWRSKTHVHTMLTALTERGDLVADDRRRYRRYSLAKPEDAAPPPKPGTAADAVALARERQISLSEAIKIVGLVRC